MSDFNFDFDLAKLLRMDRPGAPGNATLRALAIVRDSVRMIGIRQQAHQLVATGTVSPPVSHVPA